MKVPFIIYADFEAFTESYKDDEQGHTLRETPLSASRDTAFSFG